MHKFSTAATKSSALPALRSVVLLNVPYSTFAGASVTRLVRSALSSLRDENLCIIQARTFRGQVSEGMIIAADVDGRPVLLHPEREISPGSIVR